MKLNLLSVLLLSVFGLCKAQDVNVKENAVLYISARTYMYISDSGDFNVDPNGDAIMDSESDSFSNLYVDGSSTGTAEYRRWAPDTDTTNDLLSAPVYGESFNTFATRNAAVLPNGTRNPAPAMLFGPFVPNESWYEWESNSNSDIMKAGHGYRTASNSGTTLSFKGGVETGDVDVSIITSDGHQFEGANCIGNPYTTYIDSVTLLNAMVNSNNLFSESSLALYAYSGRDKMGNTTGGDNGTATNDWISINLADIAAPGVLDDRFNVIAPGQAFFTIATTGGGGGTFTFTEDMRRVFNEGDDFLLGRGSSSKKSAKSNTEAMANFSIILKDSEQFSDAHLLFRESDDFTSGFEPGWDVGIIGTFPDHSIYTLLADNSDDNFATLGPLGSQTLNYSSLTEVNANEDLIIPLYVRTKSNVEYTIEMQNVNLPSGVTIYLEDTLENTITDLNANNFTFSSYENGAGRFYLRTTPGNTLGVDDVSVFDAISIKSLSGKKEIEVSGVINSESELELFDVSGRKVGFYEIDATGSVNYTVDVSSLSVGAYIGTLSDKEGQSKTVKLIIN